MAKNKTPLIRPLRENGSTLYVFPSASEDIGLNLNSGTTGVALSHYALLNLTLNNFDYTDSASIAADLQNYVMNFETLLINRTDYNFQESYTVSEHVFWHWLMNHGLSIGYIPNGTSSNIYREDNYGTSNADRLVQCFGSIDSGNSLSTEFGMFNETYVTVPTSYGNGPVFFRSVDDNENYKKSTQYTATSSVVIEGRDATEVGYVGSMVPVFDDSQTRSYRDEYALEIVKDIPSIQAALTTISGNSTISLSSYDDVNIDTDGILDTVDSSYSLAGDETEGNKFKFNAIALYYSIYDLNDVNKSPIAINMFGVIFLDGGNGTGNYLLSPIEKKKSYSSQNSKHAYFGNSYSFRVNIKTLSTYDRTDAVINDNTTTTSAYSVDFNDVISNLNRAIDVMNTNVQTTMAIQDSYMTILSEYTSLKTTIDEYKKDVDNTISDYISNAITELNELVTDQIDSVKEELGLTDTTNTTSDGTTLSTAVKRYGKATKVISSAATAATKTFGAAPATVASTYSSGKIVDSKIKLVSASSVGISADSNVSITSRDVKFNLKDGDNVAPVSLIAILNKIHQLQDAVEVLSKKDNAPTSANENTAVVASEEIATVDTEAESAEETVNETETSDTQSVTEILISAGLVPITGLLEPRAKKPEVPGYYLKKNTAGNIVSYVLFDGTEYTETMKCEQGKMYSMKGTIYVFDGTTCKVLGS